jgi:AcrR family transcriptional regulator
MDPSDLAPRERILNTAYDLFTVRGVRDVGIDEVISKSGVAKATLYKYFGSKNDLVLAVLNLREQRWTLDLVEAGARARGATPEERLLAIFDVFDEWFDSPEYDACAFVNVLVEMRPEHPLGRASIEHLANVRRLVANMAAEAGLRDVDEFTRSWHILMKGSIIAATEGDREAADLAKNMARSLIDQYSD